MTGGFRKYQQGQAYAELVVGFVVIGLFLFGGFHVWRYGEARQAAQSAVRFAAWERTVWEPSDSDVEKHALHRSDESLAKNTLIHQLSQPDAWRRERSGVNGAGDLPNFSDADRLAMVKPALKSFLETGASPSSMITVSTQSKRQIGGFVGRDPTFNTTTSLSLDQDVYRQVVVTLKGAAPSRFEKGMFGFALPPLEMTRSMTLIANSWAASPPVQKIRTGRQLLVMSTGDPASDTAANHLAYFGLNNNGANFGAGDLLGMVPWWTFLGGPNGLAGQFVVNQIGLDAGAANSLMQGGVQNISWDTTKPIASNILAKAQLSRNEYFNPNGLAVGAFKHHLFIKDIGAEAQEDPPRNTLPNGRRKWMGASMQNPIENYYAW
jgi:hypothetical protein